MAGRVILIEGLDLAGKSTLVWNLEAELTRRGIPVASAETHSVRIIPSRRSPTPCGGTRARVCWRPAHCSSRPTSGMRGSSSLLRRE